MLLHLLFALQTRLQQRPRAPFVVTMLTRAALVEEVKHRLAHAKDNFAAAAASAAAASAAARRPSRSSEGQPLRFTADGKDSRILLRWCDSWSDAIRCSLPPRVVYLPTLFWLLKVCSLKEAEAVVATMTKELGASLWPPPKWEALLENKDQVFGLFNKFMLQPTRWVPLLSVEQLSEGLLRHARSHGDGRYFVKGSTSCDGDCAQAIEVKGGRCPGLEQLLHSWANDMHQQCVGIQPFIPSFSNFELRTWLVPDHVTKRWRSVLTIRTKVTEKGELWGELFQPMHQSGLRVAQLIDDMLAERAQFFERLRLLGLPALRIDCGYDEAEERAFFNEFAACEAWMWSEVHGQDLAYVVGRAAGDSVWTMLEAT